MNPLISVGQDLVILRDVRSPKGCRETWMTSYEFLATNAAESWTEVMAVGGVSAFRQSAGADLLESLADKAAHLAAAEAERMAHAEVGRLPWRYRVCGPGCRLLLEPCPLHSGSGALSAGL